MTTATPEWVCLSGLREISKRKMMKKKELVSILRKNEWICRRDNAGGFYCRNRPDENLRVQLIPYIRAYSGKFLVSLDPSVSSREFCETFDVVHGEPGCDFSPIFVNNDSPEMLTTISEETVLRLSVEAISWAKCQDIEAGLTAYRSLPTDAKGEMPLRHLAALAIAGDVERLNSYKNSFEKGDRLGFVPYITVDMIDRAILIAQKKREIIEE